MRLRHQDPAELDRFYNAIKRADLVAVSGMGGITDVFPTGTSGILDTLALALHYTRPIAMFSQGIGPLVDKELRRRAAAILPRVDLIALREDRSSWPILQSLGVSRQRVITTGDDAVEWAYKSRLERLGFGVGVNLRIADYAGVDQNAVSCIRPVLHSFARERKAPLIKVPISRYLFEQDSRVIDSILHGFSDREIVDSVEQEIEPIRQLQQCRIVVTGSYHAGVFAASQGIPVVGIANTEYYVNKFLGLKDQFVDGVTLVSLKHPTASHHLLNAMNIMWDSAEELRPRLLTNAARQVKTGHAAYQRVYEIVESRHRERNSHLPSKFPSQRLGSYCS
jgi:polysaccharide pyruvyl transferase WcaK-like protein